MPLTPEPRPGCTRNLAVWREDGKRRQMCCCPECVERRDLAFELSRPILNSQRGGLG